MPIQTNDLLLWGVIALAGIILGVAVMWLPLRRARRDNEATRQELYAQRESVLGLSRDKAAQAGRLERLPLLERELEAARTEAQRLVESRQRAEQLLTEKSTRLQEQAQAAVERERALTEKFDLLSRQLLDQQSKKLAEQNQANLGNLLNPLREQLGEFRKRVDEVYDQENRERAGLKTQIESLQSLNQKISQDAINLTQALKADSKARGAWGEVILERLLEMAGLQSGRQYETQASFAANDGGRHQRPDVIVRLPDEKDIVIDAKVSLIGWDRYVAATSDAERSAALRDHLASVRRHIDSLSGKDYSSLPGLRTLDFVLMFVPIEAAFVEAVRIDDALYGYALAKNVSLVSPSTLLATLRTVAHLWRLQQRSESALEFSKTAALLHDNFVLLIEGIQDVGDKLDRAKGAHDGLLRRLTEGGRGSVLLQVQRLKDLGAQTRKSLSPKLLERADDADETDVEPPRMLASSAESTRVEGDQE